MLRNYEFFQVMTSFKPTYLNYLFVSDCFERGIKYVPGTNSLTRIRDISSAKECQKKCQEWLECNIFQYSGRIWDCSLYDNLNGQRRQIVLQSSTGPKYC